MVMLRYLLPLVVLLTAACNSLPGYGTPVQVKENGNDWEVTLLEATLSGSLVFVDLEYRNHEGAAFTLRPENLAIVDHTGKEQGASGRFPYINLLRKGESSKVRVVFENIVAGTKPLYLLPLRRLTHANPRILLKTDTDTPLPGAYTDPEWDRAR